MDANAPFFSIIIPTFNRQATLLRAVDSVLQQTCQDFELIVVDDGSTDGTMGLLAAYEGRLKILRSSDNRGVSAARNRGIHAAQGEWLAFLDSDDEWRPGKLEKQTAFIEAHPDIKVVQTDEVWIRNGERIYPKKYHKKESGWIFIPMLARCLVSPSAVVLHRSVFKRVGLFDENMPACEDYDLWLRLAPFFEIHNIEEELVVKYGGHDDQLSTTVSSLDRWRIYSLLKIRDEIPLADDWRQALQKELQRKCDIYSKGLIKRGRMEEAAKYRNMVDKTNSRTA